MLQQFMVYTSHSHKNIVLNIYYIIQKVIKLYPALTLTKQQECYKDIRSEHFGFGNFSFLFVFF